MQKYIKLDKPLYADCDCLNVYVQFKPHQGYCVSITPCHVREDGLVSTTFCKEYYEFCGRLQEFVVKCDRRSKKRQETAERIAEDKCAEYVAYYLNRYEKLSGNHVIVEEGNNE